MMVLIRRYGVGLLTMLALAGTLFGQGCFDLQFHWGYGPCEHVVVENDRTYSAFGAVLLIHDWTDPINPSFIGSFTLPSAARGLAVSGGIAYVALYPEGVWVIDASDPAEIKRLAIIPVQECAWAVAVKDDYLYVADARHGTKVLDIRNPAAAKQVAKISTRSMAMGLAISGSTLCVLNTSFFQLVNIHDPPHPKAYEYFPMDGDPEVAAIQGNRLVWIDYWGNAHETDITSLAKPVEVRSWWVGDPRAVLLQGSTAYVATTASGPQYIGAFSLNIYDMSAEGEPARTGSLDLPGYCYELAQEDNAVYAAGWQKGLMNIDVSIPASPMLSGTIEGYGRMDELASVGQYLLALDSRNGLLVLEEQGVGIWREAGRWEASSYCSDMVVAGTTAYVATQLGISVLDIGVLPIVSEAAFMSTDHPVWALDVGNGRLFTAEEAGGVRAIDVTDPGKPLEIVRWSVTGRAEWVRVYGAYLMVEAWSEGYYHHIQFWNIADLPLAEPLGRMKIIDRWQGGIISGRYLLMPEAYTTSELYYYDGGFRIYDLSTPGLLTEVSNYQLDWDYTLGLDLDKGLVLLANRCNAQLVDVSDPAAPALLRQIETADFGYAAMLEAGTAYVSVADNGILGFDTWECPPIRTTIQSEFDWYPPIPAGGLGVHFRDLSDGYPSSRHWDFGDGSGSDEADPRKIYALPGDYTVTLTVANSWGTDQITKTIRVVEPSHDRPVGRPE
jgi:hypothetical protein